jgi:hypothetical protein
MAPQNKTMDGQLLMKCVVYAIYGLTFVAFDYVLDLARSFTDSLDETIH